MQKLQKFRNNFAKFPNNCICVTKFLRTFTKISPKFRIANIRVHPSWNHESIIHCAYAHFSNNSLLEHLNILHIKEDFIEFLNLWVFIFPGSLIKGLN
jgi:hypothetical protein